MSIERVKTHFRENKRRYLVIVGVVGAVGGSYWLGSHKGANLNITQAVYKPQGDVIGVSIHIEALGDPGNIIQDTTTGIVYASQNQAARELGLNQGRISDHLNGRTEHVAGHTFVKLGKAQVAE